jgi:hypothetical protein
VKQTKACVIYDASFGSDSGHEVALSERANVGRKAKQELEKAGFQARLSSQGKRTLRLWYLATNAPFEKVWDVMRRHFEAYLRFELMPMPLVRVSHSFGDVKVHPLWS